MRALSNIKIVKLWSGCTALHVVCIDGRLPSVSNPNALHSTLYSTVYGNAHFIGRNTFGCFGISSAVLPQTPPDFAYKVSAKSLPGATATTRIIQAACARHHTVLVGSEGQVWVAGKNDVGQCGVAVDSNKKEINSWTKVKGKWEQDAAKVVQVSISVFRFWIPTYGSFSRKVSCGLTFTLYLADNGWVYASGSCEKGQLGNGRTGRTSVDILGVLPLNSVPSPGERIVSTGKTAHDFEDQPLLIRPFTERKIVMIASGQQHSLALSDDGYVWAWGESDGFSTLELED